MIIRRYKLLEPWNLWNLETSGTMEPLELGNPWKHRIDNSIRDHRKKVGKQGRLPTPADILVDTSLYQ